MERSRADTVLALIRTPKVPVLTCTYFDTDLAGARPAWTTAVRERADLLQVCILVCLISLINIPYHIGTCDAELCSGKGYHNVIIMLSPVYAPRELHCGAYVQM